MWFYLINDDKCLLELFVLLLFVDDEVYDDGDEDSEKEEDEEVELLGFEFRLEFGDELVSGVDELLKLSELGDIIGWLLLPDVLALLLFIWLPRPIAAAAFIINEMAFWLLDMGGDIVDDDDEDDDDDADEAELEAAAAAAAAANCWAATAADENGK